MTAASTAATVLRRLGVTAAALVLAVVLWAVFLEVAGISPLIGKRPWDVFAFFVTDDTAAENRRLIADGLAVTVRDAGIGYLVGLVFAFLLAVLFSMSPALERIVMPTAMVLRSIPLIVLTPLISLIFGIGLGGVTAIVIIVVFLPALANILYGLRSVPAEQHDLVTAYGGNAFTLLRTVSIPTAVPSLLASARVSIPSAVTGAMIGEWLSTGEGLGGIISRASGSFSYDQMWAAAVTVAGVTVLAYAVVSVVDTLVTDRLGETR
ncbi:ABC transporter permease [Mycetocola reblochoni]|uniref:Hydroxymethylpyrimidine ABC transporter, transmembrane component n=2 Tax=Mycetocola reblochoni TaxID=331618 RepID=A0A1R4KDY8_9MICO|nr:ABC transporter permease subunit [Mycetocola reblochoni]RLP71094.1 ABC transporter permease subunit [Mycetocola reblochoni]SJN42581.1 Hydroxymethylpyrimidine ABC transporter, transmembrane component [Mycetocola reblochoni REB411]